MNRRMFLKNCGKLGLVSFIPMMGIGCQPQTSTQPSQIQLPKLPFNPNSLTPHISAKTIEFHYKKHHLGYINKLNKLIKGSPFSNNTLDTIIQKSVNKPEFSLIFKNAAQAYNHTFYWSSLHPKGGGPPKGKMKNLIDQHFGSYKNFYNNFHKSATTLFGSGWTWLIFRNQKLEIINTQNADTPISHSIQPILCVDVWEHAYYLDYQNRRSDYVKAVLDNLINWQFAEKNMSKHL